MKEKKVVEKLINNHETTSSMESCTAGYFATTITNVDGSIILFSCGSETVKQCNERRPLHRRQAFP